MGYKVDESQLAYRLNYKYAMYKGEPIYLFAKLINPERASYRREENTYELWAYKVGVRNEAFRVDCMEPTFSCALTQAGYCYDRDGNLSYLLATNGTVQWVHPAYGDFEQPDYTSPLMLKCLKGEHDSFSTAVSKVSVLPRKRAWAFHRDFCLERDRDFTNEINIMYRCKRIGTYDPKTNKCKLRSGPTIKLIKRKLDRILANSEALNEQAT